MKAKRPSKLQNRIFISYLALAIFVLLIFSLFFYNYVSNLLIEQETRTIKELTASFKTQTDSVIKDMDSVSINLNYNTAIKDLLGKADITLSQSAVPEFTRLCVTVNGAENKADQINLYDYQGSVLRVGLMTSFTTASKDELSWIEQTKIHGGSKLLSAPYIARPLYTSSLESDWYISLFRSYYNAYGRNVGTIETSKRCKSIFRNIASYQKRNDTAPYVYVYNQEGVLLFPFKDDQAMPAYDYFSEASRHASGDIFTNPLTKRNELLAFEASLYSGWTFVAVQDEAQILRPVNQLLNLLLAFILSMLIGSVLISLFISRSLVKPLKELKREVKHTGLETLGAISEKPLPSSFEELEELHQTFQDMRKNLKTSMDELIDTRQQELKSRTLALQSQINPHFYYNSLASIIVLSENKQSDEVIKMCRNLTNIMRYITDTSVMSVTLREEIDYIERYLYCMKIRYQTSLNYMIDIDPALLDEKIPKLLIQPLVENAIKYGTDKNPPWGIAIHGEIYDDHWQIDVMDSGLGFTDEALELINNRIKEATKSPGMPEIQLDGMGLLNVYLRWKLYCKGEHIMEFKNSASGHGLVSIGRYLTREDASSE